MVELKSKSCKRTDQNRKNCLQNRIQERIAHCSPEIIAVYKILEVFDKMSAERSFPFATSKEVFVAAEIIQ